MLPNAQFVGLRKEFWAHVRTLSQAIGYVDRLARPRGRAGTPGPIKIPTLAEMHGAFERLGLDPAKLVSGRGRPTALAVQLGCYFDYRARVINEFVAPRLMEVEEARQLYTSLRRQLRPARPVPLNKQSAEKKKPAYFTGIVNMLIEANAAGLPCDYDPHELTTITHDGAPFRTLARRVDGAFPSPVNPVAIWEIKEYYYTTTFGSRVADGVYESLLDGLELEELRQATKGQVHVQHLLMIDARYTWWVKGRSYLCRIVDMLHMGYLNEALFGREVRDRLPAIVREWVAAARRRGL